jgi:hypothetical protein
MASTVAQWHLLQTNRFVGSRYLRHLLLGHFRSSLGMGDVSVGGGMHLSGVGLVFSNVIWGIGQVGRVQGRYPCGGARLLGRHGPKRLDSLPVSARRSRQAIDA